MSTPFDDVQRHVLVGRHWVRARHLALEFGERSAARRFLELVRGHAWPTPASGADASVQSSLGFTRRGLERAHVRRHIMACFALKAPAFSAGAAMRASSHLAVSHAEVPGTWAPPFAFTTLDAFLSLHAKEDAPVDEAAEGVLEAARATGVEVREVQKTHRLPTPAGETEVDGAAWTHFGYRDGLSHVGIEGWTPPQRLESLKPSSRHAPGEFVLGHPQDSGANPWIAGTGSRVWPAETRRFFHNGSFGVLQQISQDVAAFERFVGESARTAGLSAADIKAKLCGRRTDGRRIGAAEGSPVGEDFDYEDDAAGAMCPFGAHARRMNPRGGGLAHSDRSRPLLRRGMPYGAAWAAEDLVERGLIGQFFCASIEDQYEHLVAQWGDRVPLGSEDLGGARDPIIGAHEPSDGAFHIPRDGGRPPLRLQGLRPFTTTRGVAYLFYPSLSTLDGIARNDPWHDLNEDDD